MTRTSRYLAMALVALLPAAALGAWGGPIAFGEDGEPLAALAQSEEREEAPAPVKHIKLYAENWKWTPNTIRVEQGTRVHIDFVSRDASHSFVLKEYKIKVPLPQDAKASIEFVADRVGEFPWICGRPCGNGCPKMNGKLIVEPAPEPEAVTGQP